MSWQGAMCFFGRSEEVGARVGHSYMYLITLLRRRGIYHGAIYLRIWNSLHPISIDKSKFCHFR